MFYNDATRMIVITEQFINENCCYKPVYNFNYWRDASRVGYAKGEMIMQHQFPDNIIESILDDLPIYECLGLYQYFGLLEEPSESHKYMWERVLLFNPYREKLIHNAYLTYFNAKNMLLSLDILNYPEQKKEFITSLIFYESDTEAESEDRIRLIEMLEQNQI
jgi:hypothetical protein